MYDGTTFHTMLLLLCVYVSDLCAFRTLHPNESLLQIDSTYTSLVDTLIDFELFICRVLKFQLTIDHPHKVKYLTLRCCPYV